MDALLPTYALASLAAAFHPHHQTLQFITQLERKIAIELNNGRAAQMGILALMVHEKLDGDPYVINTLLGSPVDFH
mgnify:CR=1 FL=1